MSGIKTELRTMWASEANTDEGVIRARTHNLVVYVTDSESMEETTQWIIESTAARPGRVIVVYDEHGKRSGLDAWVTTFCRTVNHRQICGEMITLDVGATARPEIHGTVMALLAPDLPVVVWWTTLPDAEDHLFGHLAREADRVLVDSDNFSDSVAGLCQIASLYQNYRIADLTWSKVTSWRKLLAQVWDIIGPDNPMKHLDDLSVTYAATSDSEKPAQAILILGWLAARLDWTVVDVEQTVASSLDVTLKAGNRHAKARITRVIDSRLPPGSIQALSMHSVWHHNPASLEIEAVPAKSRIEIRSSFGGQDHLLSTASLLQPDTMAALSQELDFGFDPIYTAALEKVASKLEKMAQGGGRI